MPPFKIRGIFYFPFYFLSFSGGQAPIKIPIFRYGVPEASACHGNTEIATGVHNFTSMVFKFEKRRSSYICGFRHYKVDSCVLDR